MRILTLVRGLPGAGKSTYARSLGCLHLEQDQFLVQGGKYEWSPGNMQGAVQYCQNMAQEAMAHGCDLVVSNTFTRAWEMQPYLDLAGMFAYDVVLVEVRGDFGSIHDVPPDTMKKMRDRWEHIPGAVIVDNRKKAPPT